MNSRSMLMVIIALAIAGCNSHQQTRSAPALSPSQNTGEVTIKKNLLEEVGDTTVRIVQEPVRLMVPKKADPKKPEVYDAPELVINRRGWVEPASTAPAHP